MDLALYNQYRRIEQNHWWCVGRRQIILDLLKQYVSPASMKEVMILDVGCHTGLLVGELQQRGYQASGVDVWPEAIAFGRKEGVKNLYVGNENLLPFTDGKFTLVLCLDVLEHIEDDHKMLREIARVLKPSGMIIAMVPAFNFLWGVQDKVARHFRRYGGKPAIRRLAAANGFSVLRLTYFIFFLFIPVLFVRLWGRIMPPKRSSDFDLNNRFINNLFLRLFRLEIKLLQFTNLFVGVSLLAILRKNAELK